MMTEFLMSLSPEDQLSKEQENDLRNVYETLNEKDRRRLAALEAKRLPHGGIQYMAGILGCSERTLLRGIEELEELDGGDPAEGRVRREGAGRPKK